MDLRRRLPLKPPCSSPAGKGNHPCLSPSSAAVQASDALPIPIRRTNILFSALFIASSCFLITRWREKIRYSTRLHVLTLTELSAIVGLVASLIYRISFFGVAYVQSFIISDDEDDDFHLDYPVQKGQNREGLFRVSNVLRSKEDNISRKVDNTSCKDAGNTNSRSLITVTRQYVCVLFAHE